MPRITFAAGAGRGTSAAERAGASKAHRARPKRLFREFVIALLLEVERRFLGQPQDGLGLVAGAVRPDRPFRDHDLTSAHGSDHPTVATDAGAAAQAVADAVRGLHHRDR